MAAPATTAIVFSIHGPITRSDLPGLCNRVCGLFERERPDVAYCDVAGILPDAVTVDALCRLQLAARRHRCRVRLRNGTDELLELVELMGLTEVLRD